MTDDLTAAVEAAIYHEMRPGVGRGPGAAARAALDTILAQGGVTEGEIVTVVLSGNPDPPSNWNGFDALSALMARAIATATAELRAEVERLRHFERVHDGWKARAERAEAERDELRAEVERLRTNGNLYLARARAAEDQVQRVRELCDDAERQPPTEIMPVNGLAKLVRAVLDRKADR